MKLQELFESTMRFYYKAVPLDTFTLIFSVGYKYPTNTKFVSVTDDKSNLKTEFGNKFIKITTNCKFGKIVYSWGWMQDHPDICEYVTGKTLEAWKDIGIKEFPDSKEDQWDFIDNEIEELYSDEKEIILVGLKELNKDNCEEI